MTYRKNQLLAGILYVSLLFVGPFTLLIIPEKFLGQTNLVEYISNNQLLVIAWILGDLLIIFIEVVLSTTLYKIFKEVNQKLSLIAYLSRLAMVVIMFANVLLLLRFLGGASLTNESADSILSIHHSGIYVWEIFFFAHLLLLGYLVISKFIWNRVFGYGLMIGSFGYLIDPILYFFKIENNIISFVLTLLLTIVAITEISFGIYLMITKKDITKA